MISKFLFSAIVLILIFPFSVLSQKPAERNSIRIMFYNVENLFDTIDDPETDDNEFTPQGDRHWTPKKFEKKIENTAKVIVAAGGWESPAIIGLCEIENQFVLEKLCNHPLLKKSDYHIIHKESPDHRGIDVALLYRKDLFIPETYSAIPVLNEKGDTLPTREILHVTGAFQDGRQFHFFVSHWPSRYGGLMETENGRKLAAKCLKQAVDNVQTERPDAGIICMGDFNDQPYDESIRKVLGASPVQEDTGISKLVNISSGVGNSGIAGTLKHQQEWAVFDQFIISRNLLSVTKTSVFTAGFLLEPDAKFTGNKPFRTYAGFRYTGGFSDHLPVLLDLQK